MRFEDSSICEHFGFSMSTITDLPDAVLQKIVDYLPDQSKYDLGRASRRLLNLIDNYYGKVVVLGLPSSSMKKQLPRYKWIKPEGFEVIRLHGVRCCRVGKLLDPVKSSTGLFHLFQMFRDIVFKKSQPLSLKYPNLLRKLQFEGRISPHYFEALTTRVHNLKSLSLHWKTLSSLNHGVLDPLYFPKLMTLDIWGGHNIKRNAKINFQKLCNMVGSLSFLLKNVFLSLRSLRLDLPNEPWLLKLLTSLLLAFLHRHAETLLIFKLELIPISISKGDHNNSQEEMKCSPELYQKIQNLARRLRLKTLELTSCDSKYDESSYLHLWTTLAMGLRSIQEFQGPGLPLQQDIAKNIISNNKMLRRAHVSFHLMDSGGWKPVDCSIFSNCHVMTQLFMEGSGNSPEPGIRRPGLVNVHYLPTSLKTLSIRRIPVLTSSLESIVLDMNNLQHFRLLGAGNTEDFGISVNLLNSILIAKKIKVFAISCNSIRLDEEKKDSVPSLFFKTCLRADAYPEEYLRAHNDDILEVRLQESGFYEVAHPL